MPDVVSTCGCNLTNRNHPLKQLSKLSSHGLAVLLTSLDDWKIQTFRWQCTTYWPLDKWKPQMFIDYSSKWKKKERKRNPGGRRQFLSGKPSEAREVCRALSVLAHLNNVLWVSGTSVWQPVLGVWYLAPEWGRCLELPCSTATVLYTDSINPSKTQRASE